MPLLRLEHLSFGYDSSARVLTDVGLTVDRGELVVLLGKNGSGKSTLLKLLLGREAINHRPYEGEVYIDDVDVAGMSASWRARSLSYVPQHLPQDLRMDVLETVRLGRYPHAGAAGARPDDDDAVVEQVMRECEVWALRARPFLALSGGERQRVILAGCLAQATPLILLDEPTSALDLQHGLTTLQLLRGLVDDQGRGVLLTSHDINLAAGYADRLIVLHHGRVEADGPPAEVLTEALMERVYGVEVTLLHAPGRPTPVILPTRLSTAPQTTS